MKKIVSLTIFFLRTFHFNPLNNPVFIIIAILIVFFYVEGSLDKYHLALMLYLAVLGHCFAGNMFQSSRYEDKQASRVPMNRHFQALPLSGRNVYIAYLFSSFFYAVLITTALVVLLTQFMHLPDLSDITFTTTVTPDGDTVTTVTGLAFSPRLIPYLVSFDLEKSIFFDAIARCGGTPLLIALYFILAFIYISVYQVFREFDRAPWTPAGFLHRFPLGVYLLFTLIFLAEVMLSQREMGIGIGFIRHHVEATSLFFIGTVLVTILSVICMSKTIVSKLKGSRAVS